MNGQPMPRRPQPPRDAEEAAAREVPHRCSCGFRFTAPPARQWDVDDIDDPPICLRCGDYAEEE